MKQYLLHSMFYLCGFTFLMISCENKLTVLGEDSSNLHAFEAINGQCEKDLGIKISFRPNSFESTLEKANNDFKNKTGLFDIVLGYNFSLSSYVCNHYVWDVDSLLLELTDNNNFDFEHDIFPNAWKEVGYYYDNPLDPDVNQLQKIGYPFATNTMILVYNRKMFESEENQQNYKKQYGEELTIPKTWEQYRKIAKFFTIPNKTYGVCMQGAVGGWLYYEYCDILYGNHGSVFKKKYGWEGDRYTKITIDSPEAIAATQFYLSLKPYNKGSYINIDATEQVKNILEGDVAMGLVWSDYLLQFIPKNPTSIQFGFAPIPGTKSPIAGGCFYVNRNSKNHQEAMKYILYMMKPEIQVDLTLKGLCSPFKSTYNNSKVKKEIPYAQALSESLDRGSYMFEAGLEADFVRDIITNHIQQLWQNEDLDIPSELHQIAKDIEIARKNVYESKTLR